MQGKDFCIGSRKYIATAIPAGEGWLVPIHPISRNPVSPAPTATEIRIEGPIEVRKALEQAVEQFMAAMDWHEDYDEKKIPERRELESAPLSAVWFFWLYDGEPVGEFSYTPEELATEIDRIEKAGEDAPEAYRDALRYVKKQQGK